MRKIILEVWQEKVKATPVMNGIKEEIADYVKAFLKQEFDIAYESVNVLLDQKTLIIRMDAFLSPAEVKSGVDKNNALLIQEMYSKLFENAKGPFSVKLNQVLSPKKVVSIQTGISFETRVCFLTFILG